MTMTDDAFVRLVQTRLGVTPDGQPGPMTLAALDKALPGKAAPPVSGGLFRIVWHWTAGTNVVSDTDRDHYHFIIGGDGTVTAGRHAPEANISTSDGAYAAHTRNCNTGAIGVAVAGMMHAGDSPFYAGPTPIRANQIDAMIALTADLIRKYGIALTPQTVLSHAEVEPTLGIAQDGKWDISWLPGMARPGDPVGIGNILRGRVLDHMKGAS